MDDNKIRLQKYLSAAGLMSRRAAEKEIEAGHVRVNGVKATIGDKVDITCDKVEFKGRAVDGEDNRKVYVMLYKPVGYITTMKDEYDRKSVAELIADVPVRVYPIGRLDKDSEGLLLLTNDGELANRLTHPKYHKKKIYHVRVAGQMTAEEVKKLGEPTELDGYMTKPVTIDVVNMKADETTLRMELFEGRNRQIRRMCEKYEIKILSLKRVQIGDIKLGDLHPGKWKYLTRSQAESLGKT